MKKDSYTEYKDFAEEFVLPLLNITNNNLLACYEVEEKYFVKKDNFLLFGNGENALIKVEYKKEISEDDINLVNNILQMFFRVSEFNMRIHWYLFQLRFQGTHLSVHRIPYLFLPRDECIRKYLGKL